MSHINPILPLSEVAVVNGIVSWNDDRRKLIINKPLRTIFGEMNDRKAKICYCMEFCMNMEKLHEKFHEHIDKGEVPVLLFFTKEECASLA